MKFALIGHPVAHSLSPVIHQAAYRELGVSHEYGLIDAPSEADFDRAVAAVRSGELCGVNITIPWKRRAFASADLQSPVAEQLGVCNVLELQGGKLVGHNTDVLALEQEFAGRVSAPRALVLGSGGAVPAVVAACRSAGIHEVFVTARRFDGSQPEDAWPGAAELTRLGARLLAWPVSGAAAREQLEQLLGGTGLVVQCTSAGMQGADSGEPLAALLPWSRLSRDALAYDLIYAPLETPFLRTAAAAGLRTAHGLHMLVGQAQLAIEIWLGKKPPAAPLLEAALAALAARRKS